MSTFKSFISYHYQFIINYIKYYYQLYKNITSCHRLHLTSSLFILCFTDSFYFITENFVFIFLFYIDNYYLSLIPLNCYPLITNVPNSHNYSIHLIYQICLLPLHHMHCFNFSPPTRNHKIHHDLVMTFWFPPKIHLVIVLNFWIPVFYNIIIPTVYLPNSWNHPIKYPSPSAYIHNYHLYFYTYHLYSFIDHRIIHLCRTLYHFTYYQRIRLGLSLYSQF